MEELAVILHARDIDLDPLDRRIMCFPHIVNICCQHVLKKVTNTGTTVGTDRDPIARARNIVCVLCSSGQRRDAFQNLIQDGNVRGWFQVDGESVQLRPLQLLRDVKTRWDSVYFMIKRLRELRPVCNYYSTSDCDSQFICQAVDHFLALPINDELAIHRMTNAEWTVLADCEVILEV